MSNVTVNASVSMIQPNTSRRVSQSVILLVDKRGGSDTPRSPNKRKMVRRQRLHRPQATAIIRSPQHLDENTIIDVVPHEVAPGIAAPTRDRATFTRERHHRNPPRWGNSNMHDGGGPLRGHNGALKRRAGMSVLTRGSQQAPVPRAIPPPELEPQIHDHASAGNVTEHRRPDRICSFGSCRQ